MRSGCGCGSGAAGEGPSALVVLNAHSGRVQRLIPVGPQVGALAVDAWTHTAVVLVPQDAAPGRPGLLAAVLAWGQRWWPGLRVPGGSGAREANAGGSVRVVALR